MFKILLLLFMIILSGCAANLSVDRINGARIDSGDKTIILLTNSIYNPQIKKSLLNEGFKIKENIGNFEDARYGINITFGRIVDFCLYNKNVKFGEVSYDIIDINKNESVMFINQGGWTGDCFPSSGDLFTDLAKELSKNWN